MVSRYILSVLKQLKTSSRTSRRRSKPRRRMPLVLESLEPRLAPDTSALYLQGTAVPTDGTQVLNQIYNELGTPLKNDNGAIYTRYLQPGIEGATPDALLNTNQNYVVNGSAKFTQVPKSSDWWTNL